MCDDLALMVTGEAVPGKIQEYAATSMNLQAKNDDKNADCIILELKVDHTLEEAIQQIKDRKYALRLKGKLGKKPQYTSRILAVGISYDRADKKHKKEDIYG